MGEGSEAGRRAAGDRESSRCRGRRVRGGVGVGERNGDLDEVYLVRALGQA